MFNTFPGNIGGAEIKLRLGRSLFRSLAIPFHRLDAVLFNAVAACIAGTEIELSLGQTLICGFAEPVHSLGIVLFNAVAVCIAGAEIELRFGMALFGSRREILYRGFKILCLQCGLGFAKVLHACRFRFFRVLGFRFLVHFTVDGENKRSQDDREREKIKVLWRIRGCSMVVGLSILFWGKWGCVSFEILTYLIYIL